MAKASTMSRPVLIPNPKARLFDQVREVLRFHHYALRTEQAYVHWIRRFLVFHRDRAPRFAASVPKGAQSRPGTVAPRRRASTLINSCLFLYFVATGDRLVRPSYIIRAAMLVCFHR